MPNLLVWSVGNRNPAITETITSGGAPVDLSSSTVKFKAREVGSSTLLIDAAATFATDGTDGAVVYAWSAADASSGALSAARQLLVWWEVTTGAKTQDVGEAVIEVRAHAPLTNAYVELEQLKATLEITESYADLDLQSAITAAGHAIDQLCNRRFYTDADANQVRKYTASSGRFLHVDDLVTLTTLKTDGNADGTYETTWTVTTDYVLEPANAAADSWPYTTIRRHPLSSRLFPVGYPNAVEVTGKFGWPAVPAAIIEATRILAGRFFKRTRETPYGVVTVPGLEVAAAIRIGQSDPDVTTLIGPYMKPANVFS